MDEILSAFILQFFLPFDPISFTQIIQYFIFIYVNFQERFFFPFYFLYKNYDNIKQVFLTPTIFYIEFIKYTKAVTAQTYVYKNMFSLLVFFYEILLKQFYSVTFFYVRNIPIKNNTAYIFLFFRFINQFLLLFSKINFPIKQTIFLKIVFSFFDFSENNSL